MSKFMNKKRITLVIVLFITLVVADKITKPLPLYYDYAINETVTFDNRLEIIFHDDVKHFVMLETESESDASIMAYTTLLSAMTKERVPKTTIKTEGLKNVYYEDGVFGSDKTVLYGKPDKLITHSKPNMALNYYFLSSAVILVITLALRGLVENKRGRAVVTSLLSISSAYVVSNFIIKGFSSASYFPTRDFLFVIAGTFLLVFPISYMLDDKR